MIKLKVIFFLMVCSCAIDFIYPQEQEACKLNSKIDPKDLPSLPEKFQLRVEINSLSDKTNLESFIIYDLESKKAEVSYSESIGIFKQVFFFNEDKLLEIRPNKCETLKISESLNFYSILFGENLQPPSYFFHFNNGFDFEFIGNTTWRGIAANQYKSCQKFATYDSIFTVNHYFKKSGFKPAIEYDNSFPELPVGITIQGQLDKNVSIEYNFFEFRTFVERKEDFFTIPHETYCEGQTLITPLSIPESFSYTQESIFKTYKRGFTKDLSYSSKLKAVRIDLQSSENIAQGFTTNPVKIIHDYNSGVGYSINKLIGNCTEFSLSTKMEDQVNDAISLSNYGQIQLKSPNMMFHIDDTYYYAGQKYERGILCDVFVSNRTDYKVDEYNPEYFLFELFVFNNQIPISIHITAPKTDLSIVNHIYNFDSTLDRDLFDISKCYQAKNKITFGIRFKYAEGVDQESFSKFYGDLLKEPFDELLLNTIKMFDVSPLRIVPPKFKESEDGFIIYSGFTKAAPSKYQFMKKESSVVDTNLNNKDFLYVSSLDDCADRCLSRDEARCFSFDFCNENGVYRCAFYNQSLANGNLKIRAESNCDLYSKITDSFDVTDSKVLYRTVEEAILKKSFNLNILDESLNVVITFPSIGIFETSDDNLNSGGSSSFFKKFRLSLDGFDFSLYQPEEITIRKKTGISIDECSRLCLREPSFNCETMTYMSLLKECKWSSMNFKFVMNAINESIVTYSGKIEIKNGYSIFIKNPLNEYIKYPYDIVTSLSNDVIVSSDKECAYLCNNLDGNKKCKSFSVCLIETENFNSRLYCTLSEENLFVTNTKETIELDNKNNSTLCTHYTKKALNDYIVYTATHLGVKYASLIANSSVEACADFCSYEDSFFCRSFDFSIKENNCLLYKENYIDRNVIDLNITKNEDFNHYSRITNDVIKIKVVKNVVAKFSAGTIFGVVISVSIGGVLIGVLTAFAYLRFFKNSNLLPVMKFTKLSNED